MVTPRLAFINMVSTLTYLGLAVLGWGGFAGCFSHPSLIALVVALFVMAGAGLFSCGNVSPGVREDRGNRWVLVAFGVIALSMAYFWFIRLKRTSSHEAP